MSEINYPGFPVSTERNESEILTRKTRLDRVLPFHVKYLDQAFGGIAPNDFIIFGAYSGCGKTELVTHIATMNALSGKRVTMFALEAEPNEIESRIKYKIAAMDYYKNDRYQRLDVKYRNWYFNKIGEGFEEYEQRANETFLKNYNTLRVIYRTKEYFISDFKRDVMMLKGDTDLIIVDHLNYFDSEETNENKAVTEIVKNMRDVSLHTGLPIVLVAHLRKRDKRMPTLLPDMDEFHGSSNTAKNGTKVFLLARDREEKPSGTLFPTYIKIDKCRFDGSIINYVAKTHFDIRTNSYSDKYTLGFLKNMGQDFEPIENEYDCPSWAKQ